MVEDSRSLALQLLSNLFVMEASPGDLFLLLFHGLLDGREILRFIEKPALASAILKLLNLARKPRQRRFLDQRGHFTLTLAVAFIFPGAGGLPVVIELTAEGIGEAPLVVAEPAP